MEKRKINSIILIACILAILLVLSLGNRPVGEETDLSPDSTVETLTFEPRPPVPDQAGMVGKDVCFFDLMAKCGFAPLEIKEIEKIARSLYDFRRIYPGQSYEIYSDGEGHLERLKFSINDETYLDVRKGDGRLTAERRKYPFDVELKTASGTIKHSLFTTLQEQSSPLELGIQLTDIFAWTIDFFTDVHKDDYFRIIYEEKTRKDGLKKIGRITATEFNTRGQSHYAFLFENETGLPDYFDENGKSLRKQLLKAPLSYTRISSSFSRRRYHPIRHHYAAHLGIDYVAPAGTPIQSTGDGTVIKVSRTRANGRYIKIRHSGNYITYYLHLSRFAAGIASGVRIKQGQVIGYVGSSGYATGPHLDYRVKKNGRFVNPRKLSLPPAKPVSEGRMASFMKQVVHHLALLRGTPIEDWRSGYYAESASRPTQDAVADGARGQPSTGSSASQ